MDQTQNRFISVSYQLFSIDSEGKRHIEEQTEQGNPFTFVSGFSYTLDALEQQLVGLKQGDKFDITLTPAEAFGEYYESNVHKADRKYFSINGHFDHENIYPGATINLQDNEGHLFPGTVTAVDDESVTIDTNHPFAGLSLEFIGVVLENREATTKEIEAMLNSMSCGCGCDDCDGDCHHEDAPDHPHGHGGCGCGHCHQ